MFWLAVTNVFAVGLVNHDVTRLWPSVAGMATMVVLAALLVTL